MLLPPHDRSKIPPLAIMPLCKSRDHTTSHLFSCQKINTTLNVRDLWDDPVDVAALLQQWTVHSQGAAGGGTGVQPDVRGVTTKCSRTKCSTTKCSRQNVHGQNVHDKTFTDKMFTTKCSQTKCLRTKCSRQNVHEKKFTGKTLTDKMFKI